MNIYLTECYKSQDESSTDIQKWNKEIVRYLRYCDDNEYYTEISEFIAKFWKGKKKIFMCTNNESTVYYTKNIKSLRQYFKNSLEYKMLTKHGYDFFLMRVSKIRIEKKQNIFQTFCAGDIRIKNPDEKYLFVETSRGKTAFMRKYTSYQKLERKYSNEISKKYFTDERRYLLIMIYEKISAANFSEKTINDFNVLKIIDSFLDKKFSNFTV